MFTFINSKRLFKMNKITRILAVVVTCLAIGYFSGIVTRSSIDTWYPTLIKPSFNPPNWVFAPAWSLLYLLMGVAAGLVWDRIEYEKEAVKNALVFFAIQLALNALWSYLFFGLMNPLLALIEIFVLWLMIYETLLKFIKINKVAGYLLVPYLLWVSFATILNASIWWLNK
jgi:tryptophan-rich sensory protein